MCLIDVLKWTFHQLNRCWHVGINLQVDNAETGNTRKERLPVRPDELEGDNALTEHGDPDGRYLTVISQFSRKLGQ